MARPRQASKKCEDCSRVFKTDVYLYHRSVAHGDKKAAALLAELEELE